VLNALMNLKEGLTTTPQACSAQAQASLADCASQVGTANTALIAAQTTAKKDAQTALTKNSSLTQALTSAQTAQTNCSTQLASANQQITALKTTNDTLSKNAQAEIARITQQTAYKLPNVF